jgi:hypothetical protein
MERKKNTKIYLSACYFSSSNLPYPLDHFVHQFLHLSHAYLFSSFYTMLRGPTHSLESSQRAFAFSFSTFSIACFLAFLSACLLFDSMRMNTREMLFLLSDVHHPVPTRVQHDFVSEVRGQEVDDILPLTIGKYELKQFKPSPKQLAPYLQCHSSHFSRPLNDI